MPTSACSGSASPRHEGGRGGPGTGDVHYLGVPASGVAMATLHGSFDGMSEVMDALGTWISEHDLRISGPMVDVYRVSPASGLWPEHWVTDVCVPVADAG